jgi:hypothetical protein
MGTIGMRQARPILTERDYAAVKTLLAGAPEEQMRLDALLRELADYDNRGSALNVLYAVAWAEWVFVPRCEPEEQPRRRWADRPIGFGWTSLA